MGQAGGVRSCPFLLKNWRCGMTEDTVFARCVALDASAVLNERQTG